MLRLKTNCFLSLSLWAASACNDDHYCVLIDAKLFLCYQGLLWITAKLQFPGSSLASAD